MPTEPTTRLTLERWATGDLPPDEARALELAAQDDPDLSARMDRMQDDLDDAARELPRLVLPDAPPERSSFARWWMPIGAVLAAALALFIFWPAPGPPSGEVFRGALDLSVVRIREGVAEPQTALIAARAGDRLQYTATSPNDGYLTVYDVQDDGTVTVWLEQPVRAMRPVEGAAILDDYLGGERVFFVLSPERMPEDAFMDAVHDVWNAPLADLDEVPGLPPSTQRSLLLVKEAP